MLFDLFQVVTPPTAEPIDLPTAKLHLRVDADFHGDDALIELFITAARQEAEKELWRALVTQTWKCTLDAFPRPAMNVSSANWYGPQWGVSPGPLTVVQPDGKTGYEIELPPLQTVGSIKYIDTTGVQQTLASNAYKVVAGVPTRVLPVYGAAWPDTRNEAGAIEVTFTCGYGNPDDVPAPVKAWMLLQIGAMYEIREAESIVQRGSLVSPAMSDRLLNNFRAKRFE